MTFCFAQTPLRRSGRFSDEIPEFAFATKSAPRHSGFPSAGKRPVRQRMADGICSSSAGPLAWLNALNPGGRLRTVRFSDNRLEGAMTEKLGGAEGRLDQVPEMNERSGSSAGASPIDQRRQFADLPGKSVSEL